MKEYKKLKIALRYFLRGKDWYLALDALEYGARLHTGTRKDGVTPEFQHQVEMALYMCTLLPSLLYPQETIAAIILHDTPEDKAKSYDEMDTRFGTKVATATELMNKHRWSNKKDQFDALAEDAIGSVAKGADRSNNLSTMQGVFTLEKQRLYVKEAKELFIPMLKAARRNFVFQEPIYENEKLILLSQIDLLTHLHTK